MSEALAVGGLELISLVSFILPYLLNVSVAGLMRETSKLMRQAPYANLESDVGWIFGSVAVTAFVYT